LRENGKDNDKGEGREKQSTGNERYIGTQGAEGTVRNYQARIGAVGGKRGCGKPSSATPNQKNKKRGSQTEVVIGRFQEKGTRRGKKVIKLTNQSGACSSLGEKKKETQKKGGEESRDGQWGKVARTSKGDSDCSGGEFLPERLLFITLPN